MNPPPPPRPQPSVAPSPAAQDSAKPVGKLRWGIVALLFTATLINYLDRQALSVAAPTLSKEFNLSESDYARIVMAFLASYCVMHVVMGRVLDWIGIRVGLVWAVTLWSVTCVLHAAVRGAWSLGIARFFLGAFEAANFPAGVKAVGEWFPVRERTIATGIFTAGSGLAAILAPPLIAWLILSFGWRSAFIIPGAVGFVWLGVWLWLYRDLGEHPRLSAGERNYILAGQPVEATANVNDPGPRWTDLFRQREFWGVFFARMLTDPVNWFYMFWLPKYLSTARGFDLAQIALFAWVPFVGSSVFSVVGGMLPAWFIKRGMEVIRARKIAMLIAACCMPIAILAVGTPSPLVAVLLITVATSGHTAWAASLVTLPADLFPKRLVATAYGLTGAGGTVGGILLAAAVGEMLETVGYGPVFVVVGCLHLIGAAVIFATVRTRRG